jgi:hypothetical protein
LDIMIFVHKRSSLPITPWSALRHGGINNLSAGINYKYLVLVDVDIVHRKGEWHYVFHFDARNTLEKIGLAHMGDQATKYPGDMDWKKWLGDDWEVIKASAREEILKDGGETDPDHADAAILNMRAIPNGKPRPKREPIKLPPRQYEEVVLPDDFMLAAD